jgi:thiamine-phosphate pyrophosphorylase
VPLGAGSAPARCQLYLAAPAALPADFAATLAAALDAATVACLRLPALPDVAALIGLAQRRGTAVLFDGRPELAARLGADGAHLADPASYGAARRALGEQAIVGIHCATSRHAAMEAGEAGADYVAFAADLELVRWWAELMVVPVVAEIGDDLEQAAAFAAAGADFICPGEAVWREPDDAPALLRRAAALIA